RGEWLEVRRTAWVHNSTLSEDASEKTLASAGLKEKPAAAREPVAPATERAARRGATGDATTTSHGEIDDAADSTPPASAAGTMVAHGTTELRAAPGGKRTASIDSSASVTVLARERGWT